MKRTLINVTFAILYEKRTNPFDCRLLGVEHDDILFSRTRPYAAKRTSDLCDKRVNQRRNSVSANDRIRPTRACMRYPYPRYLEHTGGTRLIQPIQGCRTRPTPLRPAHNQRTWLCRRIRISVMHKASGNDPAGTAQLLRNHTQDQGNTGPAAACFIPQHRNQLVKTKRPATC